PSGKTAMRQFLTVEDIKGLRHLYYQRVYTRVARQLEIPVPGHGRALSEPELEDLRHRITRALGTGLGPALDFNGALWGWNFGFGFAQSGHRLHASHQMIHQQNALVPRQVYDSARHPMPAFACGDLVTDFIRAYAAAHDKPFFDAYIQAIRSNRRTDGSARGEDSLIIHEDDHVMLFVPKAQVNEWELQVMTRKPVPHILAADTAVRTALDGAIFLAVRILEELGADMITSFELSGRFDDPYSGQHLIYSFIPRLPYAPPTFSEAQLRWISGAYPEDVAQACRQALH
ncbi:MAG: hypothetical protein ACNA7H_04825, partial [Desulfotignum sp.]